VGSKSAFFTPRAVLGLKKLFFALNQSPLAKGVAKTTRSACF